MTRDSLAKLRALAEAATPGPWTFEQPECLYESIWAPNPAEPDALYDIPRNAEDQRFIAAANPAAVLSILDELARIRRLAEEACDLANDVINEFYDDNPAWAERHAPRRAAALGRIRKELSK